MPTKIQLRLSESVPSLRGRLRTHIKEQFLIPALRQTAISLNSDKQVHRIIVDAVKRTDTWGGLEGYEVGDPILDLQAVLGIEEPDLVLSGLEDFLLESIEIIPRLKEPLGLFIGVLSREKQEEMLSADFASYVSDTSGEEIPWLRWLLLGYSDPVIGYSLRFGDFITSRTGRAIMARDNAGYWSIDEHLEFGPGDNFISEAFEDQTIADEVLYLMSEAFLSTLNALGFK